MNTLNKIKGNFEFMNEIKIRNDNGIENAKFFNFDAYSSVIAEIISSDFTDTPLTIGIFGEWGSGKTSLMKTIQKRFEKNETSDSNNLKTIWFNAWEQCFGQGGTLIGTTLLYHIYKELGGESSNSTRILNFGKKIATIPADIMLRAFGGGITFEEVKNKFEEATTSKASLAECFQESITDFLEENKKKNNKGYKRVVFFIDDLDRCLPENIIEILEVIKLFLNANNCIFVIGVDKRAITTSIKVLYKDFFIDPSRVESPITGDNYLEKIIQLSFHLPPLRPNQIQTFINEELDIPKFYEPYIKMISEGIEQNPRKIKRFFNNVELQRSLANNIEITKKIMKDETQKSLFEATLIEWAIINTYYPISRRYILEDNGNLIKMHEYFKGEKSIEAISEKFKDLLESGHEINGLKNLINAFPDRLTRPTEEVIQHVIHLSEAIIPEKITLKPLTRDEFKNAIEQKEDLKNINLVNANLEKFEFPLFVNLSDVNLNGANLKNAEIRGIELSRANLSGADLSEANLARATLHKTFLNKTTIKEANLHYCNLSEAFLEKANLSGADLSNAELYKAVLKEANLTETNLESTDLRGAILIEANLKNATFDNNTKLFGADIRNADFTGAYIPDPTIFKGTVNWLYAKLDKSIEDKIKDLNK